MMGLGYLGGGVSSSSSSSSNLSPLAPPFTVDRSNPKPNSNPLAHSTETPYAVPFSSSLQNWPYSHSSPSRPDFLVDSIRTTSMPSTNDYGFMSSESINPPTAHWSALNPSVKTGSESINPHGTHWSTLNRSPKSVADSFSYLSEAKPYYPPYVSPVINDDIPLAALTEANYDLLSTSGLVSADGSSQVDYTRSLSELDYAPQWDGSIWNGLAEGKQGKRMETSDSFFSEEANMAGSLAYKNHMKQGACGSETLSISKEESTMSLGNYAAVVGRENHLGPSTTGKLDGKSLATKNLGLVPIDISKATSFRAFPIIPESRPQATSPEPPRESWNNQKPYTYEKGFQIFDACKNDCISITKSFPALVIKPPAVLTTFSSSPALVIKPPAVLTTFSAPGTFSSKNVEIGKNAASYSNDFVGSHNPWKEEEPHLLPSSEAKEVCLATNQLSFQIGRNDHHFFVAPSSTKEEMLNKLPTMNERDYAFSARSGFQVPDINVPDVDSTETVKSAEDSPCWKGAPTSHFSSFEAFEDVTPEHRAKKLQTSNGMNLRGTQINCPYNDSPKVSLQELCEKTIQNENVCMDNGFSPSPKRTSAANLTGKEHKSGDTVNAGFDSAKPSTSKGVQLSHDIVKPGNGYGLLYESNTDHDTKNSYTKPPSLEEDVLTSKRKLQLQAGVVDHASHTVENVFLSSIEDAAKPATLSTINVQMMVKAMHNLSKLLLFHCSNDLCALNEKDHEALDLVIGNLDACMSRKIVQVTQTQESMLPKQGTSNMLVEGACAGKSRVTNEAAASSLGQLNSQFARDEKRNYDFTGKKVEKLQGFVSLRDDADLTKDHKMVQAIKKVLDENLQCEEELQPQTLLYKNLWLEAEAELCSISYRARFERMKREMEKFKTDKAKDVSENTVAIEKLSSSSVSPDPNITQKLTPEANGSPIRNTSVQDSPLSSPDGHLDDVEASVMARFHILKCRGESNPVSVEERELAEVADAGFSVEGSQSSDVTVGPCLLHQTGKDDAVVKQSRGNNRMNNQFGPDWNNSSHTSSDWEHVMKDEFAWQS